MKRGAGYALRVRPFAALFLDERALEGRDVFRANSCDRGSAISGAIYTWGPDSGR